MESVRPGYVVVFVTIVFCILVFKNTVLWKTEYPKDEPIRVLTRGDDTSTDLPTYSLPDLFVQPGYKYSLKDGVIYNCLTKYPNVTVKKPMESRTFTLSGYKSTEETNDTYREKAFVDIFENQLWIDDKKPKLDVMSENFLGSGGGSSLQAAQAPLALLNALIERLKISLNKPVISMVDVPCGDFHWMKEMVGLRSDVQYTGMDIVPSLIERNNKHYGHMKNVQFKHGDVVKSSLHQSYDIIFCRDMLQHLSNKDVMRVLDNFSTSGSKLLVITNIQTSKNTDIGPGGYRHMNLMLPPASLVPPVCTLPDVVNSPEKSLAVWTLPLKQRH